MSMPMGCPFSMESPGRSTAYRDRPGDDGSVLESFDSGPATSIHQRREVTVTKCTHLVCWADTLGPVHDDIAQKNFLKIMTLTT